MLFLIDKLYYFVEMLLTGAAFLVVSTLLWWGMRKWMKCSGNIRFLYGFLLLSMRVSSLWFLSAIFCICLPREIPNLKWSLFFHGWHMISGVSAVVFYTLAFLIWLIGLLCAVLKIRKQEKRLEFLYQFNRPVTDEKILNLFYQTAGADGLEEKPELFYNSMISIPFVKGVYHPFVVIPETKLSEPELILTFAHELTHLKKRDLVFRHDLRMLFNIYWFVPLEAIWMNEMIELQESLCDIEVCRKYGSCFSASVYYNTILSISGGRKVHYWNRAEYAISKLSENVTQLEHRIKNMIGYRYGARKRKVLAAMILGSGVLLYLVMVLITAVPDVLFLPNSEMNLQEDGAVEMEMGYDLHRARKDGRYQNLKSSKRTKLQWDTLAMYTLQPGERLNSGIFQGTAGQDLALIVVSSESGYEICLRNEKEILRITRGREFLNLTQRLTNEKYELYLRNTGNTELELEIYCTK